MKTPRALMVGFVLMLVFAVPGRTQLQQEGVDLDAIASIKREGLQRSQVMEIASYLTDVHGPGV